MQILYMVFSLESPIRWTILWFMYILYLYVLYIQFLLNQICMKNLQKKKICTYVHIIYKIQYAFKIPFKLRQTILEHIFSLNLDVSTNFHCTHSKRRPVLKILIYNIYFLHTFMHINLSCSINVSLQYVCLDVYFIAKIKFHNFSYANMALKTLI